ncbi:unnamed protein product, partial [Didymodactylos carnosus]
KNIDISCRELNLCSLRSVKQFSEKYRQDRLPLHLLILNAGILKTKLDLTEDGNEEMFQVNYLAQVYLTMSLLPSLLTTKSKGPTRVVAVSCEAHRVESPGISTVDGIKIERLNSRSPAYFDHLLAYGQSKLCLIMFIAELKRNYPLASPQDPTALILYMTGNEKAA